MLGVAEATVVEAEVDSDHFDDSSDGAAGEMEWTWENGYNFVVQLHSFQDEARTGATSNALTAESSCLDFSAGTSMMPSLRRLPLT